jgi:hypothetical protein
MILRITKLFLIVIALGLWVKAMTSMVVAVTVVAKDNRVLYSAPQNYDAALDAHAVRGR